jgi:MoaA/NifB/PqqE/SkfB family radical SAM enzyme
MTVIYNTNGTFMLDKETITQLEKCKSVEFILSLDGYGELNERVRKNCKWNNIERFIDQVKICGYKLSVNTVLHKNNYHGLVDLENYINSLKDVEWSVNILTFPQTLDVNTVENRQAVIDSIAKTNIANKEALIKHVT